MRNGRRRPRREASGTVANGEARSRRAVTGDVRRRADTRRCGAARGAPSRRQRLVRCSGGAGPRLHGATSREIGRGRGRQRRGGGGGDGVSA